MFVSVAPLAPPPKGQFCLPLTFRSIQDLWHQSASVEQQAQQNNFAASSASFCAVALVFMPVQAQLADA